MAEQMRGTAPAGTRGRPTPEAGAGPAGADGGLVPLAVDRPVAPGAAVSGGSTVRGDPARGGCRRPRPARFTGRSALYHWAAHHSAGVAVAAIDTSDETLGEGCAGGVHRGAAPGRRPHRADRPAASPSAPVGSAPPPEPPSPSTASGTEDAEGLTGKHGRFTAHPWGRLTSLMRRRLPHMAVQQLQSENPT